jgi:hypothetical protein
MSVIDFETEYDTRATVPDHAAIIARRERAAADYCALASAEGRAELGRAMDQARGSSSTCSRPSRRRMRR